MREKIKRMVPMWSIVLYKKLRYGFITCLFHFFHLFPIKKNSVVFMNVWGYGDNAKYIAEELCKDSIGLKIYFITNNPKTARAPSQLKLLKTNSLGGIFALATARVWVDSNRKEDYIRKRKGQYYIQTWHGGLPLKKIEGDCAEFLGEDYIRRARWDSAMTDLYISNGAFCTAMYRRAFWYQGEVIECGTPRNDNLICPSPSRIENTRRSFNVKEGVKIAVYAPTYRDAGNTDAYIKELECLRKILTERFACDFILIIRLHPLAAADNDIYTYGEYVLDGSRLSDLYEAMEATDVLITDYSNTMFEFAMMKKPVFLFAKDLVEYQGERGLYFKMQELPFSFAETEEELRNNIVNFKEKEYREKVYAFFERIKLKEDGNAKHIVAGKIKEIIY